MKNKITVIGDEDLNMRQVFDPNKIIQFYSIDSALCSELSSAVDKSNIVVVYPYEEKKEIERCGLRRQTVTKKVIHPSYNRLVDCVKEKPHDPFFVIVTDNFDKRLNDLIKIPNAIAVRYHTVQHFNGGYLDQFAELNSSCPKHNLIIKDRDYSGWEGDHGADFQSRKIPIVVKKDENPAWVPVFKMMPNKKYDLEDGLCVTKRHSFSRFDEKHYWYTWFEVDSVEKRNDYNSIGKTATQIYGRFHLELHIETPDQRTAATKFLLTYFNNFQTAIELPKKEKNK